MEMKVSSIGSFPSTVTIIATTFLGNKRLQIWLVDQVLSLILPGLVSLVITTKWKRTREVMRTVEKRMRRERMRKL